MDAALGAEYNLAGRSTDAMLLLAPALERAMPSSSAVHFFTVFSIDRQTATSAATGLAR